MGFPPPYRPNDAWITHHQRGYVAFSFRSPHSAPSWCRAELVDTLPDYLSKGGGAPATTHPLKPVAPHRQRIPVAVQICKRGSYERIVFRRCDGQSGISSTDAPAAQTRNIIAGTTATFSTFRFMG